jgi:hypothetical protein
LWQPNSTLWIVTTQRTRMQTAAGIPAGKLKLDKNETLLSLVSH